MSDSEPDENTNEPVVWDYSKNIIISIIVVGAIIGGVTFILQNAFVSFVAGLTGFVVLTHYIMGKINDLNQEWLRYYDETFQDGSLPEVDS